MKAGDKRKTVFAYKSAKELAVGRYTLPGYVPQPEKSVFKHATVMLLTWVFTALLVVWTVSFSSFRGMDKWDRVAYCGIMFFIFHLFLLLNFINKFHEIHKCLEKLFNGNGQIVIGTSFLVLGFVDYLMIQIYYNLLNEDGPQSLFITLYVVYYVSLLLLFLTWMAYWETFAFYCTEYSYMHGLMAISLIGGVVLVLARWVQPSKEGD